MSSRRSMSRHELFAFNSRWSERDRVILEEDLDLFGGVTFEHSASGFPHVWVMDAGGSVLMHVAKGTVYYKGGRTRAGSVPRDPQDADSEHVYRLSTHQAGGAHGLSDPVELHPLCETCFLRHPEGECDR